MSSQLENTRLMYFDIKYTRPASQFNKRSQSRASNDVKLVFYILQVGSLYDFRGGVTLQCAMSC